MRVQCPSCSKVFPVTAKVAGRQAKCGCGTVLQMPKMNSEASSSAVAQKIEMTCDSCSRRLSVPASAVGKQVQCPCGVKSLVPNASAAPQPANQFAMPTESFGNEPFADNAFASDPFDSASSGGGFEPASTPAYLTAPKPRPKAKKKKKSSSSSAGSKSGGPDMGQVLGGLGMMVGAVVWFVAGIFFGWVFFYPPILLIIGLVTMIKGFVAP